MVPPRRALLLALLVMTPALAGCNIKDWYDQNGTVRVQLRPLADEHSLEEHFQSVKIAIYGVTLRQHNAVNPKSFAYDEPKIVDVLALAKEGEEIAVTEFKTSLLPIVRVQFKIVAIEAIDAAGQSMEICRPSDRPAKFPCFYQPADDNLEAVDLAPFSPPRGGTIIAHIPLAVKYAQQGRVSEYFLFADPSLAELEKKR